MTEVGARIGMVNFINTAPLYEVWKETVNRADWQVVEGAPSLLNRMLFEGALDLGFVSSQEYAIHPGLYRILSGLSISATGAVGSVYLFSEKAPQDLGGEPLLLSAQSQTSNSLIRIILEEFYQVKPLYRLPESDAGQQNSTAVLAIGDQALRLKQKSYPFVLDLSEEWQRNTGLPFVFAVWAVREDFCRGDMDAVLDIHTTLLACIEQGREQLATISRRVAPRIPMDPEKCYAYLQQIEYDLSDEKLRSLQLFYRYLIDRNEGDPASLPLKICGV